MFDYVTQVFHDVVIWESILLFLFIIFTTREVFQLKRLIKVFEQLNPIHPEEDDKRDAKPDAKSVFPVNEEPELKPDKKINAQKYEQGDNDNGSEGSDDISIMPLNSDPNIGRNVNLGSHDDECLTPKFPKKTRTFLMLDFNDNNLDDLEELEALIEKSIPGRSLLVYALDWATVLMVLGLLILRAVYILSARGLHEKIIDLEEEHQYSDSISDIDARFDEIQTLMSAQRLLLMIVMFVGVSQFFRFLSFDSRLAIVADTLTHSARDLFPVLCIFIIVLMGYAVLGSAAFGQDVESWSTVPGAMLNLMVFIVGEYGTYMESKYVHAVFSNIL